MRMNSALFRAGIWLLILLGPVGAPLIGAAISNCPNDPTVQPTGPFAMAFAYCGVSRPVERLYQHATMLSLLPMAAVGPALGGLATLAWWVAALGSAAGLLWNLWRALAAVTVERI